MKKRKKVSRMRGSHTHSRGFKKKARGKGHRGGIGKSGSGKRADHKKNMRDSPFGKRKTWRKKLPQKIKTINLKQIADRFSGKQEANLKDYKILGSGELAEKIIIKASAASQSALDKVKKAGGDIIIE